MLIVLTGFACNGKTTTLSKIKKEKFVTVNEPVRYFLNLVGTEVDFQTRQAAFLAAALAQWDLAVQIRSSRPVIMDRCFVDVIVFSRIHGLPDFGEEVLKKYDLKDVRFFYILPPPENLLEVCFKDSARMKTLNKKEFYRKELEFRKEYENCVGELEYFPHPVSSNLLLRTLEKL